MALPSSGQISLNDINVELGNTAGTQCSLRTMSSTAGFTTPDAVSEFYGYSSGDSITYSWGALSIISDDTTSYNAYRVVSLSGLSSASIRPYFSFNFSVPGGNSYGYYSVNSTSSWTYLFGPLSTVNSSYYGGYVSSGDVLRVRITANHNYGGSRTLYVSITSTYQVQSGSVSSYSAGSPVVWSEVYP